MEQRGVITAVRFGASTSQDSDSVLLSVIWGERRGRAVGLDLGLCAPEVTLLQQSNIQLLSGQSVTSAAPAEVRRGKINARHKMCLGETGKEEPQEEGWGG